MSDLDITILYVIAGGERATYVTGRRPLVNTDFIAKLYSCSDFGYFGDVQFLCSE